MINIQMLWEQYSAWIMLGGFFLFLFVLARMIQKNQTQGYTRHEVNDNRYHHEEKPVKNSDEDSGKSTIIMIDLFIIVILFVVVQSLFPRLNVARFFPMISFVPAIVFNIIGFVLLYYLVVKPIIIIMGNKK